MCANLSLKNFCAWYVPKNWAMMEQMSKWTIATKVYQQMEVGIFAIRSVDCLD